MRQKEQEKIIKDLVEKYNGKTAEELEFTANENILALFNYKQDKDIAVCDCGFAFQIAGKSAFSRRYDAKCPACGCTHAVSAITTDATENGQLTSVLTEDLEPKAFFEVLEQQQRVSAVVVVKAVNRVELHYNASDLLVEEPEKAIQKQLETMAKSSIQCYVSTVLLIDDEKLVLYKQAHKCSIPKIKRKGESWYDGAMEVLQTIEDKHSFQSLYGCDPCQHLVRIEEKAIGQRKKRVADEMRHTQAVMDGIAPFPFDKLKEMSPTFCVNKSELINVVEKALFCLNCGTEYNATTAKEDNNGYAICPKCGKHVVQLGKKMLKNELPNMNTMYCWQADCLNWQRVEDTLIAQLGMYRVTFNREDLKLHYTVYESYRVLFDSKRIRVFQSQPVTMPCKGTQIVQDRIWVQEKNWTTNRSLSFPRTIVQMQTNEEIANLMQQTEAGRKGLAERLGYMTNTAAKTNVLQQAIDYVSKIIKHPELELIVKSGLKKISEEMLDARNVAFIENLRLGARTPAEALGISKWAFKKAREFDLSYNQVVFLKRIQDADPSMTWDDFKILDEFGLGNDYRIPSICDQYGIRVKKVIDYLNQVYQYQCIDRKETVMLWHDYLFNAKALRYNLNDKSRKYPTSLKKAHDIASWAYKAVSDQAQRDAFSEACNMNRGLEYKGKKLSIVVPKEVEDLTHEGTELKHCVRTYVERIAKRDTLVCFIRKNDDIETPYYTVEVKNGVVEQVKGYCNRAPVMEVETFVTEWAHKRSLILNYR